MMRNNDFAIFILTHGRADKVLTYKMLKKLKYSGKIYFIVDNDDEQIGKYIDKFGKDNVKIFDKREVEKTFDTMDNFNNYCAVSYARNQGFILAKELGVKYFLMLDDDYSSISYTYNENLEFKYSVVKKIEGILDELIDFYKSIPAKSIAIAQAGDFIGGDNGFAFSITRLRKCMNFFLCCVDRPFASVGTINEDVSTYVLGAKHGDVFLTIPWLRLTQGETQANKGGMTDFYLDKGTYVKSFYTVMISPSSVSVAEMGSVDMRLHHRVEGNYTYPMIIRESIKNNEK